MNKNILAIATILILLGYTSMFSFSYENIHVAICKDILLRMEKDFFHYESEEKNIERLLTDCLFEKIDLNNDGQSEIIVKLNWLSEGRFNITKGHNYIRGAQDQGSCYIYIIQNGNPPRFLGNIQGGTWKVLPSSSNNYNDIESIGHDAFDKAVINQYRYTEGKYISISSILYQFDESGKRKKKLKIYK